MPVRIRTLARICACLLMLTFLLILLVGLGPNLAGVGREQLGLLGKIVMAVLALLGLGLVGLAGLRIRWSSKAGDNCVIEPAGEASDTRQA